MSANERVTSRRLRIGELAGLAGTTARAIRHYHAIGLLAEPARDDSGYRRYGAEHLVRLVRIRRLRALDMPLDQIATHLSGDTRTPVISRTRCARLPKISPVRSRSCRSCERRRASTA